MVEQEGTASPPPPSASLWSVLADMQDKLALVFGVHPEDREATLIAMLGRGPGEIAGYWLKLMLAMGIASLGLVLGSTAVVIGAMLISPLMGPLVELGMGLAVGSPLLVLRSFARTTASILFVVTSAALLTLALPFQEVTPEIAARTAPTALDLLIAILCAVAAAYTTLKPGSDTSGTAAGTAIGIALVPPLCVVGYGFGIGAKNIWSGAILLFVANLCAILLFAVLSFLALGFGRARAAASEQLELERQGKGAIRRIARGLRYLFGTKYGSLLRVLMPVLLVGGVYLPLREALAQVTWQVRVRASIQRELATLPDSAVRTNITVEPNLVAVQLVTLGRAEDAARLEKDLTNKIAAAAGLVPKVHVIAVPDASALDAVTARIEASKVPMVVAPKVPALDSARTDLAHALEGQWPTSAGRLVAVRVVFPEGAPTTLEAVHLGPPLGPAGAEMLGAHLTSELGTEVAIRDVAIPSEPIVAEPESAGTWLPLALGALAHVDAVERLFGCAEVPVNKNGNGPEARNGNGRESKNGKGKDGEAIAALLRAFPAYAQKRLEVREGPRYRMVVSTEACPAPSPARRDGDAAPEAKDGAAP